MTLQYVTIGERIPLITAAAASEQSSATGTAEVTSSIGNVSRASEETGMDANAALGAAGELGRRR